MVLAARALAQGRQHGLARRCRQPRRGTALYRTLPAGRAGRRRRSGSPTPATMPCRRWFGRPARRSRRSPRPSNGFKIERTLLHARRRAGRHHQGEAERALRRGAEDHRSQADLSAGIIVADYLPAGFEIDNPRLVSSGDTGTLRLDRGRRGADALRIPRRPFHRGVRPRQRATARCSPSPTWCARCRLANTCCRRRSSRTCTSRPLRPHRHRARCEIDARCKMSDAGGPCAAKQALRRLEHRRRRLVGSALVRCWRLAQSPGWSRSGLVPLERRRRVLHHRGRSQRRLLRAYRNGGRPLAVAGRRWPTSIRRYLDC